MKVTIFFILTFQFCLQCSYVYVNPDYHSASTKKNLLIYPVLISNIAIQDSTLLKLISKDFKKSREDALQVVDSLLHQSIVNAFKQNSDSSKVQITTFSESIYSGSSRHIPAEGFHFDTLVKRLTGDVIPSADYFAEQNCQVDYILFVSGIELDISYDLDIDGGFSSPVIEVSLANRYVFDADEITYRIWDYTRNRFISKATIHTDTIALRCEQPFVEVQQNGQCDNRFDYWPALFAPIGTSIVNATPFKKDKDEGWGQ